MKFGAKLSVSREPDWREHYVDYDGLKGMLRRLEDDAEAAPATATAESAGRLRTWPDAVSEASFFDAVEKEMDRVNAFYKAELTRLVHRLEGVCNALRNAPQVPTPFKVPADGERDSEHGDEDETMQGLSRNAYRDLQKLRNFALLNYSGFTKVLKKWKKRVFEPRAARRRDAAKRAAQAQVKKSLFFPYPRRVRSGSARPSPRPSTRGRSFTGTASEVLPIQAADGDHHGGRVLSRRATMSGDGIRAAAALAGILEPLDPHHAGQEAYDATADPSTEARAALRATAFADGGELDSHLQALEQAYARAFTGGDVIEARSALLVRQSGAHLDWFHFRRGAKFGVVITLVTWFLWDVVVDLGRRRRAQLTTMQWLDTVLPAYRGFALICLGVWLAFGVLQIWEGARINYTFLLDEPFVEDSATASVYDLATHLSMAVLTSLLLHLKATHGFLPLWFSPGLFLALLCALFPVVILANSGTRRIIRRALWSVVSWTRRPPSFFDGFAVDILTSLVKPFGDLCYAACFVATGEAFHDPAAQGRCKHSRALSVVTAFVCLTPTLVRGAQNVRKFLEAKSCHPALTNTFKYFCSFLVGAIGVFHAEFGAPPAAHHHLGTFQIFWLGLYVFSSCVAFAWDVYMDWGLCHNACRRQAGNLGEVLLDDDRAERATASLLRWRLLYKRRALYLTIIVVDLFGRFFFMYSLIPTGARFEAESFVPFLTPSIAAVVEVIRRALWSVLRLEAEQLGTGPEGSELAPLHFHKTRHPADAEGGTGRRAAWEIMLFFAVAALVLLFAFFTRPRSTDGA